jgi:ABC-type amino acid transport substrate-binding protein
VTGVQEQLDAVEQNQADVAVAAISITDKREKRVDYSHRYFESGLGVLTQSASNSASSIPFAWRCQQRFYGSLFFLTGA